MIEINKLVGGSTVRTRMGGIYVTTGPVRGRRVRCLCTVKNKIVHLVTDAIEEVLEVKLRLRLPSQLDVQVGGSHYKETGIQPIEYIHANQLDFLQGAVVKYVTRYKSKNGVEDLKKAVQFLQFILELQCNIRSEVKYDEVIK